VKRLRKLGVCLVGVIRVLMRTELGKSFEMRHGFNDCEAPMGGYPLV
jgi:hypothetical protein